MFCRDRYKSFVATKDVFCCDKHVFVTTKMILGAATASDKVRACQHAGKSDQTARKDDVMSSTGDIEYTYVLVVRQFGHEIMATQSCR